jgi:phosphatidate cytidylyltransferase
MTHELKQRLLFSALGIPMLLIIFYLGGWFLWMLLFVIAVLGFREFCHILPVERIANPIWEWVMLILTTMLIFGLMTLQPDTKYNPLFIALGMTVGNLIAYMMRKAHTKQFWSRMLYVLGILYTLYFPGLIYLLDQQYHQSQLLLLLLVMIWVTDSAAYFIGMRFGRHRGIFPVSPNKSLEGFIAGLIAPFIFVFVINYYLRMWTATQLNLVAVSAGLFGQLGDLLESKLKRMGGVKDSSHLIPGHGGVLDRFDSLLIAAPVLYLLITVIP